MEFVWYKLVQQACLLVAIPLCVAGMVWTLKAMVIDDQLRWMEDGQEKDQKKQERFTLGRRLNCLLVWMAAVFFVGVVAWLTGLFSG